MLQYIIWLFLYGITILFSQSKNLKAGKEKIDDEKSCGEVPSVGRIEHHVERQENQARHKFNYS
jgi:hypothetical protein